MGGAEDVRVESLTADLCAEVMNLSFVVFKSEIGDLGRDLRCDFGGDGVGEWGCVLSE